MPGGDRTGAALFVTGTDTGVGKTAVACGLLHAMRKRGVDVGALKPVETGHDGPKGTWPPDARALAAAAETDHPCEHVVPFVFEEALAPLVASERSGRPILLERLDDALTRMRRAHEFTIVEGAGGLAVPVTRELTMADLAARWNLPVLLVARAGLGTINHTVLTVEYARARGLRLVGLVLNRASETPDAAQETNPQVLESMTDVRVLGSIPDLPGVDVENGQTEAMGPAILRLLELDVLLRIARGEPIDEPSPAIA